MELTRVDARVGEEVGTVIIPMERTTTQQTDNNNNMMTERRVNTG